MKIYTKFRCSDCQAAKIEPPKTHKVVFILFFLLATFFSPYQESFPEFISTVYGAELSGQKHLSSATPRYSIASEAVPSGQSNWSAERYRRTKNQSVTIEQKVVQKNSLMQQSRMMNSSTCGRPWKSPLAEIQGQVRNVEYRVQPFTGRRGLHIDVETGYQKYTVIHVYPERLTAKCPSVFYFRVGDTVKVTGSEFFTSIGGSQQNICAATITQGEKMLGVRDSQTGALERQLCCQEICEKNCSGLPPMCDLMCMGNCKNRQLKAVFQNLPFHHPSQDKDYSTATLDR
jgi:hypothetical protein